MHDDRRLVEQRIRRELFERVMPAMYSVAMPMTVEAWDVRGEPVAFDEAMAATYEPFAVGQQWSRPWGTTWFRMSADVPAAWVGSRLEAVIDLGFHQAGAGFQAEGMVWTADGPLQGVHPRRTGVPLPDQSAGRLTLMVEAASNPAFPGFRPSSLGSLDTAGDRPLYRLKQAMLGLRDDTVFHLLLDVEVLLDLMAALPEVEQRRQRLLRTLERAFNAIDLEHINTTAAAARAILAPALAAPAVLNGHHTIAVGHAHIDSAWLWPIRETVRKCARTFASATRLMDDYPDYRFVCSQAAQYEWMERRYPEVFERIKAKVASGQWQPVGAMWVEADMNLPSGESLVRQLVHGQRYFESRFGMRCNEVWIPDVFGYPASLPQIFAAAGCHRFVTQKLSWNKQNVFPHSTFWWRGLDGTKVLTHFPPVDTYNAEITGGEMVFIEQNFKDHGWSDWSITPFGHGNGGGGPTREMVERARRFADLNGSPRLSMGTTDQFFERVEAEAVAGAPVPVWDGELYFEMHRGTLTSQIETKVGNRRCEQLLRELELWQVATVQAGGSSPTAADCAEVDELWHEVLLQQFHDIIPGSSIAWVHRDAEAAHARVATRLEELIAQALGALAMGETMIANATTHDRMEVVTLPSAIAHSITQTLSDGSRAAMVSLPGLGLAPALAHPSADHVVVTEHTMANGQLAVSWDLDGEIISIVDVVAARELLPVGRTITVEWAPDHPVSYDAWDVEAWTRHLGGPLGSVTSVDLVESGPLLARLSVERAFGYSSMTQTYTLRAGSARLDISFDIDWHEDEKLLSLMIPLDVRAREAACGIQFGHVMRPTHASSTWDAAKFEVCAHRYVDVSEPSWGVAVLNDGRYGHCLSDGGVRVSLVRAAKYPDPTADHGRHRTIISILPHGPGLHDVIHEAECLDLPLRVVDGGSGHGACQPVVSIDHPGIEVSAVKLADAVVADALPGDVIVRLYEACGDRSSVTIRLPGGVRSAWRCNLLEEPTEPLDVADGIAVLTVKPFELATLRLRSGW